MLWNYSCVIQKRDNSDLYYFVGGSPYLAAKINEAKDMLDTNTKKQWMWNSSAFYHARWTEIFWCSILLYSSSSFKIKYWNAILILTILCFFSKSFLLSMKDVFFIIFVISTFFLLSHYTYCLDLAAIICLTNLSYYNPRKVCWGI